MTVTTRFRSARAATLLASVFLLCSGPIRAQDSTCCAAPPAGSGTPRATLTVSTRQEDTLRIVTVHLTGLDSAGHFGPLARANVGIYVQRLFGIMPAGEDHTVTTDAAGTAEFDFPDGIPGDPQGDLTVVARVEDNDALADVRGSALARWGTPVAPNPDPFPRALWEPGAPFPMILTFAILFGGVWIAYGVVFAQLFTIRHHRHGTTHDAS